MSRVYTGVNNPFYGKKHSEETKTKWRLKRSGENNSNYGRLKQNVGYKQLHAWLRENLPRPDFCQICEINLPKEVANITDLYNRDFINWQWLCYSCHDVFDDTINNLKCDKK